MKIKDLRLIDMEVGKQFKNYKIWCESLGIESAQGGRNRKLQQIDLKRFFDWEVDGRKITITEIYATPIEKEDGRGKSEGSRNNNNIYMQHIDPLLTNFFTNIEGNKVLTTDNQLARAIGIVNSNYSEVLYDKQAFYNFLSGEGGRECEVTNITAMYDVFYTLYERVKSTKSALRRLEKAGLITHRIGHIIHEAEEGENRVRMASLGEEETINECAEQAMRQLGINSIREIAGRNEKQRKEYYELLNKLIGKKLDGVYRCYRGYEIIINKEHNIETLSHKVIELHKAELNSKIRQRVIERANRRIEQVEGLLADVAFGELVLEEYQENILREDYMQGVEVVADYLIATDCKEVELVELVGLSSVKSVSIEKTTNMEKIDMVEKIGSIEKTENIEKQIEQIELLEQTYIAEKRERASRVASTVGFDINRNKSITEVIAIKERRTYSWQQEDNFVGGELADDELLIYSEETGKYVFI